MTEIITAGSYNVYWSSIAVAAYTKSGGSLSRESSMYTVRQGSQNNHASGLALGNVDADADLEVVVVGNFDDNQVNADGGDLALGVLHYSGAAFTTEVPWHHEDVGQTCGTVSYSGSDSWSGVDIADLNQNGTKEIIVAGKATGPCTQYDILAGSFVVDSGALVQEADWYWKDMDSGYDIGSDVVAANVDDDGGIEVVLAGYHRADAASDGDHVVVVLEAGCLDPLLDVPIEGPTTGLTDTLYAFTAATVPISPAQPINHTWSGEGLVSGQETASAFYQWATTGIKTITLLSQDCGGEVGDAHAIAIQSPAADGDIYEDDDSCGVANMIDSDGTVQTHTVHDEGDQDWVKFEAAAGKSYVIKVDNVGDAVDAVIMLHDGCDDAPLASEDNAFGPTVTMEWHCTAAGWYYLGVLQNDPSVYGEESHYDLSVTVDSEAPSPPRTLWANPASQALVVQWEASPEHDVAGYRVRWGLYDGGPYSGSHLIDGAETTYYEITGLINGSTYYLVITALDLSDNESGYSDQIGAIPSEAADPTAPTVAIDRPSTQLVYTSTVASLTIGGDCTDASNNLSRVRVRNSSNSAEGWDYGLSDGSDSFHVPSIPMIVGHNHIEVTVYDAADDTAVDSMTVRRLGGLNGAVVIVGGRNNSSSLQSNINYAANRAYNIFRDAGFGAEDINYLSPSAQDADGDGSSDVSSPATPANVRAAIQWAATRVGPGVPFFLYLMDHGGTELFCADGCTPSDQDHVIGSDDMDDWLDELETSSGCDLVNVILEACHSGSFLDRIGDVAESISEPGRVVIASTGRTNNAYASAQGAYFSDAFFSSVAGSNDLLTCFNQARAAVQTTGNNQTPLLDDNGDGLSDSTDGSHATNRYVSSHFGTMLPEISTASVAMAEGAGTILATVERGDKPIDIVWAAVYVPSFQGPIYTSLNLGVPLIELEQDSEEEGSYSAHYNAFGEDGVYRLVIYAADEAGNQGRPKLVLTGQKVYLPLALRNTS